MKTAIIIKPSAWLYNEKHSEVTDELMMGWAIGILEEKDKWLWVVTHYGYRGCLRRDCVRFCVEGELKRREESGQMVFISSLFADVMEQPGVRENICATLGRGSFVRVLPERKNGYRKVVLSDGRTGYIPCISYESRRDGDGYLYEENPETYFAGQTRGKMWKEEVLRESLVSRAKSYLGIQYRWGGKGAQGLDCSGLAFMSYQMNGILIYRDAKIEPGYPICEIPMEQIAPGDLIYFPGHVAMYIGGGRYIHSTGNPRSFGCVINSLMETDLDYRADLAEHILAVGSVME